MKSGKQRRAEIQADRQARAAAEAEENERKRQALIAAKRREGVAVDVEKLAPCNSYGVPDFVERGFYVDAAFQCEACGADEVWTAAQQKWWYESAQGFVYSKATLCRECRRRERERREEARRVHLEGLARKKRRVE